MKDKFSKEDTNIVKGVAIIFMMIHHCFLSKARYKNLEVIFLPFTEARVQYIAAFFKICVPMFVFLTAYGITISIKRNHESLDISGKQSTKYIKHRILNLYSGWIFVFFACELFGMIYSKLPFKVYGADLKGGIYFLLDGLGIANLFGTPVLVGTWWYMSLAISLVLVIPILTKIYNKIGFLYLLFLFSILSRQLNLTDSSLVQWIPAVLLGIVCADQEILEKMRTIQLIKSSHILNKLVKFIFGGIIILLLIKFRQSGTSSILFEIKNGVIPFFVIYFIYEFICDIKYLNTALMFIGKHSMNIFFIHTFIRATYFRKFIYGFKYAPLIVLVLLGISLVISVLIELVKKYLGYNKLVERLREKFI